MKLYLTRHGQTEWNLERRMQGWKDSPLSIKGIQNAKALAKSLNHIKFEEVYSSSSKRAYHTASIISGYDLEKIILCDDLREINMGIWEGMKTEDVERLYTEDYNNFWSSPHLFIRQDAEKFKTVQDRAVRKIQEIIYKHVNTNNNILIVTHTVTLKSIMAYFEKKGLDRLWEPPYIYDTCLSILEIDNNQAKILLHGDISHLEEAEEIRY